MAYYWRDYQGHNPNVNTRDVGGLEMGIIKIIKCERCGAQEEMPIQDRWQAILLFTPDYPLPHRTDNAPALCPRCLEDFNAFMEGFGVMTMHGKVGPGRKVVKE